MIPVLMNDWHGGKRCRYEQLQRATGMMMSGRLFGVVFVHVSGGLI